jgi:hypothetical protein
MRIFVLQECCGRSYPLETNGGFNNMAVRDKLPDRIAFTVELQLSTVRRYSVRVTLDLQDRFAIMSAGIIPDVSRNIESFVDQLSEIASNQLAFLKWDGTSDLTTEYQVIRVLPNYYLDRSIVRFNLVMGEGSLIQVEELHNRTTIQV